jgi:nicotinate-nucleotide pyrophosphorylase (carboxylating)
MASSSLRDNVVLGTNFRNLITTAQRDSVLGWLHADCPMFDIGGFVVGDKEQICYLYCKMDCTLAGIVFANIIFEHLNLTIEWQYSEGATVSPSQEASGKIVIGIARGPCNKLLLAERTVLNIISRGKLISLQNEI